MAAPARRRRWVDGWWLPESRRTMRTPSAACSAPAGLRFMRVHRHVCGHVYGPAGLRSMRVHRHACRHVLGPVGLRSAPRPKTAPAKARPARHLEHSIELPKEHSIEHLMGQSTDHSIEHSIELSKEHSIEHLMGAVDGTFDRAFDRASSKDSSSKSLAGSSPAAYPANSMACA